jgi:hypothetical protein
VKLRKFQNSNRKVPVAVLVKVIFAEADNAIYFANMYINTVCTYMFFFWYTTAAVVRAVAVGSFFSIILPGSKYS